METKTIKKIISITVLLIILGLLVISIIKIDKSLSYKKYITERTFDKEINGSLVYYKIFQTGLDNYTYEVYRKDKYGSEISLANLYLNDSSYRNTDLKMSITNNNCVKFSSNEKFTISQIDSSFCELKIN